MSWNQQFFDPIILPGRKPLVTLRDAAQYITKLRRNASLWRALALSKEENHDDQTYDVGCYRPVVIRCARIGCTACCFQPRLLRAVLPQCQLPKLRAGQPLSKLWLGSGALAPSSSPALALNSTHRFKTSTGSYRPVVGSPDRQ